LNPIELVFSSNQSPDLLSQLLIFFLEFCYPLFRVGCCVQWIPIRNDSVNGSHDAGIVVHLVNSCQGSNFTIRKEPQPGNIGPDRFMKRFEQG